MLRFKTEASEVPPLLPAPIDENPPSLVTLGSFRLDSSAQLEDCRLEYRTLGTLNADKSNVVVMPTWFSGTTSDLLERFGEEKLIDTSKYYVVLVGALANSVSSSPSNSPAQPRLLFPQVTIRDMVNSQHRLLTEVLGFSHVKAVVGISMGGMQAFEWGIAYPNFMDALVPIFGTPKLPAFDTMLWKTSLEAIAQDPGYHGGNYTAQPLLPIVEQLVEMNLRTPARYNKNNSRVAYEAWRRELPTPVFDANDRVRQLEAMLAHDVSKTFGGDMQRAANKMEAPTLVIINSHDHLVTPESAAEFAELAKAELLRLNGDCGHKADECEMPEIAAAIARHLATVPERV